MRVALLEVDASVAFMDGVLMEISAFLISAAMMDPIVTIALLVIT